MTRTSPLTRPLVSVVVPSYKRPDKLMRAAASVLEQTYENLELIVVLDGGCAESEEALRGIDDERIRVLTVPKQPSAGETRNRGIEAAAGEWIAFLDDDDSWRPSRLEEQLAQVNHAPGGSLESAESLVLHCAAEIRSSGGATTWPHRGKDANETVADYLFVRNGPFDGEGSVPTPTILAPAALFKQVPFRAVPRHQEWDWLLRASRLPGFELRFLNRVLVDIDMQPSETRMSTTNSAGSWRDSLDWIEGHGSTVGKKAYASFVLTVAASLAKRERDMRGLLSLPGLAAKRGKLSFWAAAKYASIALLPEGLRHRGRNLFRSAR